MPHFMFTYLYIIVCYGISLTCPLLYASYIPDLITSLNSLCGILNCEY